MKKSFYFLFILGIAISQNVSDPMLLSGDGSNSQPDIAINNDGHVAVVWVQNDGGYNARFAYSTDEGETFSESYIVNDFPGHVIHIGNSGPKMDIHNNIIHVIWADQRDGYDDTNIYYSKSSDQGESWSVSVPIGKDAKFNIYPEIKVSDDGRVHVIYYSYNKRTFNFEDIHYTESTDGGETFSNPVVASEFSGQEPCDCCAADIHVLDNGTKMVAFRNNNDNIRDMFSVSIHEGEEEWGNLTQISNDHFELNYCPASGPSIDGRESTVIVSYMAPYGNDNRVFVKKSVDYGVTFGDSILIDVTAGIDVNQDHPISRISPDGDIHMTWEDTRGNGDIFYGRIPNGESTVTDLTLLTEESEPNSQKYPRIGIGPDASIYFVWTDYTNGSDVYFSKIQGNFVSTDETNPFLTNFKLLNNYPNPFNPTTTIRFNTGETNLKTSLRIYDISGRLIESILNENVQSGSHETQWNASEQVSGVYFVELMNGSSRQVQKIILLK
ncbi:MAG: exo-alpha-sialidase [Candidatus Marinimicrobia bacterium]|nr:exo-alpha-sialidase [Candidatus Neomarinimicrobiota bacterium]